MSSVHANHKYSACSRDTLEARLDSNTSPLCTISRPDLIDMEVVSQQSNQENLEQAFEIAESLGVTRLLDAEGETVV